MNRTELVELIKKSHFKILEWKLSDLSLEELNDISAFEFFLWQEISALVDNLKADIENLKSDIESNKLST